MAGYLIAHIDVTDPEGFKAYSAMVPAIVERFGGRYLVRGGAVEALEGEWAIPRLVVIEFESVEQVRRFYDSAEYREVLPLRTRASRGTLALAKGI